MYKAVQPSGIENESSAGAFQRPHKRLRTAGQDSNNLTAFRQLRSDERTGALAATGNVEEKNQAENSATHHLQEFNVTATVPSLTNASTGDGSVIVRDSTSSGHMHRNKIEAIALTAVVIGAVVASTLTAIGQREQQSDTENSHLSPPLAIQQRSGENIAQVPENTAPSISPPTASDLYYIEFELDTTSELTAEYAEEIEYLRALNTSLRNEVDSLGDEAVDLGNNRLQLESVLSDLKSASEDPAEIRTVYNFVDVALGSNPVNVNVEPSDTSAPINELGLDDTDDQVQEAPMEWDGDEESIK